MNTVLDSVLGALDQDSVNSIARQLGTRPEQAQGAIEAALPLLLGAMGRNAAQPQGAQALHRTLERDHASSDLGSILGSVLGGGAGGSGEAILGHVFGGRQQRAAMGVGRVSGMDSGSAAQLLAMLAPLVMSALGQQTRTQGVDSTGLGGLLGMGGQEAPGASQGVGGLLSVVLDRDGDGDVDFQDLMGGSGGGLLGSIFGGQR